MIILNAVPISLFGQCWAKKTVFYTKLSNNNDDPWVKYISDYKEISIIQDSLKQIGNFEFIH